MSRTHNSIINIITSTLGQVIVILLSFISRTVLIKTMGSDYVGVNGLFSSILTVLSLAELGVGTTIIFELYKPLSNNEYSIIRALMKFYKRAYQIIGGIITIIGLICLPFLSYLIKDDISFINIYITFLIYLLQTVSTYLCGAYKSALLKADQKEYLSAKITYATTLITNLIQILILVFLRNFYLYLSIVIITNLIKNLMIARLVNQRYKYVESESTVSLSKNEKRKILKNCYAISLYKMNAVVLNGTDNIIISKFIGIVMTGIYSNYTLITVALKNLLNMMFQAILASLGNLHSENNIELEYTVFTAIMFMTAFVYGVISVCVFLLINDFITLWIGNEYLLSVDFVMLLCIDLYMFGMRKALELFRTSMGLFQQMKYRPVIGMILNLIISLVLVIPLGINGVLLGTILSNLFTFVWMDPRILFDVVFKQYKLSKYFLLKIKYLIEILIISITMYFLFSFLSVDSFGDLIIKSFAVFFVCTITFLLMNINSKECKYLWDKAHFLKRT